MTNENYLAHYGVKGMKWGVRRSLERKSNSLRKSIRKKEQESLPTALRLSKKANSEFKAAQAGMVMENGQLVRGQRLINKQLETANNSAIANFLVTKIIDDLQLEVRSLNDINDQLGRERIDEGRYTTETLLNEL